MIHWIDPVSGLKEKQNQVVVVAHTFNPSTWESDTFNPRTRKGEPGRVTAGWRGEYKAGGDRSSLHSVCGFVETGS